MDGPDVSLAPQSVGGRPGGALSGWDEDDVVLVSALEHWSYCPRQCALIHVEQTFDENLFTLRGRRGHERVHGEGGRRNDSRDGVRLAFGLDLWSDRLGLRGKADVVEFHPDGTVMPVEHKSGTLAKGRSWEHETLQLCAQALCLEEMLGVPVPAGALYAAGSKARKAIAFTPAHRAAVERATLAVRTLLGGTRLPVAVNDARCPACSLYDACLPDVSASTARIGGFQSALFRIDDHEADALLEDEVTDARVTDGWEIEEDR